MYVNFNAYKNNIKVPEDSHGNEGQRIQQAYRRRQRCPAAAPDRQTDVHGTYCSGSACGPGTQQAVSKVMVSVVYMCCFEINIKKEKAV